MMVRVAAAGLQIDHLVVFEGVWRESARAKCGKSVWPGKWDQIQTSERPLCVACLRNLRK